MSILSAKGVSKAYFLENERRCVVALQKLNLEVFEKECLAIVGPSGCGKSTLLRLFAGFEHKSAGELLHHGHSIEKPDASRALIPQDSGLFGWLSIEENVMLPLHVKGISLAEKREKAYACMKKTGIEHFAKAYPRELSGGMRQRAALARALAMEPDVLLLDEPFSALDEASRESMDTMMQAFLHENRITAVLVTHSIREALLLADRVVVMAGEPGRILEIITLQTPRMKRVNTKETSECYEHILALLS
jgi:ABC-type nitrate/sulfonate/bicarbonate transport system ATPase subunit